jgi:hemerythrin-like metal-binding protein
MSKILWHDSFSVGVQILDEHHQTLARLINRLSDCPSGTEHSETVVDAISELVQYALYHFDHEERLMAAHDFPRLAKHREEHSQFCEVITETSYGATLGIIDLQHLIDYLNRWWKNHILFEDMQFKPYFASRGVR